MAAVKPWAAVVALVAAGTITLAATLIPSIATAEDAVAKPLVAAPAAARPDDLIIVTLTGWPLGPVTVGVCSNSAARGTEDCALAGDDSIAVRDTKPVTLALTVATPPGPCPCVIRATTADGGVVVTAPIVLVGVPVAPIIQPNGPAASDQVRIHAQVTTVDEKFPQSIVAPLGGSVHKVLVVDVTNVSSGVADLHVVAEVGKHQEKEPIAARDLRRLQPGEHRRLRMPFVISAPAWGTYTVGGSVYGGVSPVTFRTTTKNDPWLLELMVPVLLLVFAELLRARERRERRREQAEAAALVGAGASWTQSSPEVGIPYEERYQVDSYAPSRDGAAPHTNGAEPDTDAEVALTI